MECLGFSTDDGVVYEGRLRVGFRAQPQPLLVPIQFPEFPSSNNHHIVAAPARTIFREDSFDPVTRIRRGRVFSLYSGNQPSTWHVHDPIRNDLKHETWARGTAQTIDRVYLYSRDSLTEIRKAHPESKKIVAVLGAAPFLETWQIVSIEDSVHGSPILTLRFQRSLAGLPEIDPSKIDTDVYRSLLEAIEGVENSNHRQGAIDVVDRCRAAASIILGELSENRSKDLGKAITHFLSKYPDGKMVEWAASIINRLHPRGKPNEQHDKGLRPPDEDDAQLAIGCLGFILKEVGWTKTS